MRNTIFAAAVLGSVIMVLNALDMNVQMTGFFDDLLAEKRSNIGFNSAYFPYIHVMHFFCGLIISWDCMSDFTTNNAELMASGGLSPQRWFFGKLGAYAVLCFSVSLTISAVYFFVCVHKTMDYAVSEILDAKTAFRFFIQCLHLGLPGFLTYSGLAVFFSQLFRKPAFGLLACTAYRYVVHAFAEHGNIQGWCNSTLFYLPEPTFSYFFGYTGDCIDEFVLGLSAFGTHYNAQKAWSGYLTVCLIGVALLAAGFVIARKRFRKFN